MPLQELNRDKTKERCTFVYQRMAVETYRILGLRLERHFQGCGLQLVFMNNHEVYLDDHIIILTGIYFKVKLLLYW